MRARLLAVVLLLITHRAAEARPVNRWDGVVIEAEADVERGPDRGSGLGLGLGADRRSGALSSFGYQDTVTYGGTYWAADSMRWEALRDSVWTFDTGVGSLINTGGNPNKPVGYHQTMEGWYGIDQTLNPAPYFRRSSTCVIAGSFSLWAGVTAGEAGPLCYAGGQGYGNSWSMVMSKTFAYPGSGSVSLSWLYAVDAEPSFDFAYVTIDTTGNEATAAIELAVYTGPVSGTGNAALNRGFTMRSTPGPFTIRLLAYADGSYSDEDGLYSTTCGLAAFDDIRLTGAVTDFTDFETGSNGWIQEIPVTGVGDYSHLDDLANLPPSATFCPCGVRDSVLVFFDESDGHPMDQDNIAASPWIDLGRGGDSARPGKLFLRSQYLELPVANYIFFAGTARYYPYICPSTGLPVVSPWLFQAINYFDSETPCTPEGRPRVKDISALIGMGAEEVQLGIEMINLCRTAPFGDPCSGITNTTPWFDNVALGVYGDIHIPVVNTTTFDRLQDNFAADGSLNPASPGRIDQNRLKGSSTPSAGTILGDTLNARGNGGNVEVRLVFKVRPGPFVNPGTLAAYTARWTWDAGLNGQYGTDTDPATFPNWYSARMDTAQQGSTASTGSWMSTFHEADPGFQGTDTTADPNDPGRLANDILPDHLFTPGSRIDYFIAARYRPPDSRNPGGNLWSTDPDTSGGPVASGMMASGLTMAESMAGGSTSSGSTWTGRFREVEILSSSMAADTTWNCVLYVDHHDDRDGLNQYYEELGLATALGLGVGNADGTRYDRFDNQTPSSAQMSFGRPSGTSYGCSASQLDGYRAVAWHSATLSTSQLTNEDAAILAPWLTLPTTPGRRFWGSGEGLMQSMQTTGGAARAFMNNQLGVLSNCTGIRLAGCPTGTPIDTTYCLPTAGVVGSYFASSIIPRLRGNGCPDLKAYDLLALNGSVATARGQLDYMKSGAPRSYASITNEHGDATLSRTVLDGFSIGQLRANPGYYEAGCNDPSASLARSVDVLDWFDVSGLCSFVTQVSAVPPGGPTWPPALISTRLGSAQPNPTPGATRIAFVNGTAGARVRLELFDVTGRLIRRLLDEDLPAGSQEAVWDGRDTIGNRVPAGLYFYRLTAPGFEASSKLLVTR